MNTFVPVDGGDLEVALAQLIAESGETRPRVALVFEVAAIVGFDRIPTMTPQQLEDEAEVAVRRLGRAAAGGLTRGHLNPDGSRDKPLFRRTASGGIENATGVALLQRIARDFRPAP